MKVTRIVALSLILASATVVEARPRPADGGSSGGAFEANKTFGLGLEVGAPTGINGKWFLSPTGALDFGVGYIYGCYGFGCPYDVDGFHTYVDYLWHPFSFVHAPAFELPFYVGVGGRFVDFRYHYTGNTYYGGYGFGARVPLGISFDFNTIPLDVFIELVPTLDFWTGDYYDYYCNRGACSHVSAGLDFSAGVRYWFK